MDFTKSVKGEKGMIENYADKKKKKLTTLEFSATGNIAIFERAYDPSTGVPVLAFASETNTKHIDDLLADLDAQMKPFLDQKADLEAIRPDVEAKEKERDEIIAKKAKEKPE
jgi:hypothetical protein